MSMAMHSRLFPLFDHARRPWPIFAAEIGDLDHDLGAVVAARMWKYASVDDKHDWRKHHTPYTFAIGPYIFEVWRAGTWQIAGYFAWHFFWVAIDSAALARQRIPYGLYQLWDIHVEPGIGEDEANKIVNFVFQGKNPKVEYEQYYVGLKEENKVPDWNCYGRHLPDLEEGTVRYDATAQELIAKYLTIFDRRARAKIGQGDFTREDYDNYGGPQGAQWAYYDAIIAELGL
ncbi:hypothetical protein PQX77_020857 [Marasmius sp. AFHP31]|nr:hypothetical protein PQX77_020857 [Marasmius sp. AFHP31]